MLVAKLGNALVSYLELVLRTQKIQDYGGLEEKLSTDTIFQGQGTSKQAKKRHCWTWNLSYIQKPQDIGDAGNLEHLPKPAADANWANLSLWDKLSVQTGTREVKYPNLFGTQIILSELQMPDIKLYY